MKQKTVSFITKYARFLTALLAALFPVVLCVITCLIDGKGVWDVYIPASTWNDELYYYKLVEAILEHGYPQGYYGFNESQAQYLSFAAWSPVLLLPWVLWGLCFGWNFLSPVLCNLFLICLALFIFTYVVKPGKWQMVSMFGMLAVFTPLVRYTFACMPEITCFFLIIVFLALAISYCDKKKNYKLVLMFLLASLATLMRPYFILFLFLPGYFLWKKRKWIGSLVTLGTMGVTGVIYAAIKICFGAEYFTDLFNIDWITTFFTKGIFSGIKYMLYKLVDTGIYFFRMLVEGFRSGLPAGALFGGFLLLFIWLFITAISKVKAKDKYACVYVHFCFCTFGMWMALLLMYKMTEGSKHLSAFIVTGILLLALVEVKQCYKWIVTFVMCGYLFIVMANEPVNYEIPYKTAELENKLEVLYKELEEGMEVSDLVPSFENDIIWLFSDNVNGKEIQLAWQMLYALPDDYGISICYADYVKENFENLKCRYIAVIPDGDIEWMLSKAQKEKIAENEQIAVYKLY